MRKFIFMMTMLMMTLSMSAQHVKEGKFFDNTYVTVGAGLTSHTTDWDLKSGVLEAFPMPLFQVELGKALTTYYTTALEVDARVNTNKSNTMFDEMSVQWLHKVNLLNVINGYKDRKFELYPVVGGGWGHNFGNHDDYGVFTTALEMDWNLTNAWGIMFKPQMRWIHATEGLNVNNSDLAIVIGVRYRFKNHDGSRGFQVCDYDLAMANNEYLNGEVNKLREQLDRANIINKDQEKLINELKNQPKDTVLIDNTIAPTIGFERDKYKVTSDKMAYLYTIANKYKDSKLMVVGYADKGTGTHKYNKELSRKRAEAIKEVLVKMGLNEQNIEIKAMGDLEQPFEDNDMNRVVIIEK